jgi:hypothetical protein
VRLNDTEPVQFMIELRIELLLIDKYLAVVRAEIPYLLDFLHLRINFSKKTLLINHK